LSRSRRQWAVLGIAFLFSGAASLIDQVVWLRYLGLVFGNTTWAAATLLAVFLGGLGLGALLFGRQAERFRRPLAAYAVLEVAIGLFALASPAVLSWLDAPYIALYRAFGSMPTLFAIGRALLAALFLLPPTILMGGTLPLVLRATARDREEVGAQSALFYGLNTAGAVLGVAFAGFLSIRLYGLYATLVIAALLNFVAAALALTQRGAAPAARAPETPPPPADAAPPRRALLALLFAIGAASLGYEVLWTRILLFHLGSSVYAYSIMLLLVLFGIALGSLAVTRWADRVRSPLVALAGVELAIALWTPVQILLFQQLDLLLLATAELLPPATFGRYAAGQMLAVLPLLGPPTLLMGMAFPFAVRAYNRSVARVGEDVGSVYGANTLGAVSGSLATGFLLIPWIGTQNSLLVVGAGNALVATVLATRGRARRLAFAAGAVAAALPACLLLFPADRVLLSAGIFQGDAPGDLEYFHEDAQATVTIRKRTKDAQTYRALAVNGVDVAGSSPELDAVQRMQGHLPMLLGGAAPAVVHIGFGSGGTAWAVSRSPVESILVVEISPEVIRASDTYFGTINHGVLADPRVRVEINDGRNFLLASAESFDAVLSDSIHPAYAGNGSLYSLEYFRLLRARMRPGGVASMWLPMYYLTPDNFAGILRAFSEVFPHVAVWYVPTTLNAFTIVTGKLDGPVWDANRLREALAVPAVASDLASLGVRDPSDLLPLLLATDRELGDWLRTARANTDDRPRVEYESARLLDRNRSWLLNFGELLALRPSEPPSEYLDALDPSVRERARSLYLEEAPRLALQAQLLAARLAELERRPGTAP